MSYVLNHARSREEVDHAILSTRNKVLVLRFGRDDEPQCLLLDSIVCSVMSMLQSDLLALLLKHQSPRLLLGLLNSSF